MTAPHILIIGGGIAGLSTAYYLQKHAAAQTIPVRITLVEAGPRLGGKLLTEQVDGFTVEAGPDSFITQKPAGLKLAIELGLEEQLLPTSEANKGVFIYHGQKLLPMPDGVMLIVPTRLTPFALSPLFSLLGKVRMGLDIILPARRDDEDETLADFVRRRLGSEALDRLAEPLMAGIYNAEAENQSILATFPRFRTIEKEHGSLIRGMIAARTKAQSASTNGKAVPAGDRPQRTLFMSLRHGIADLSQTLAAAFSGEVRLNSPARRITAGQSGGYCVELGMGAMIDADQVVLATPAFVSASLLADLQPNLAADLRRIRYVSTGTVSLAYRLADIPHPLKGFGLVIPRSAGRRINAITLTSNKWAGRAPEDHALLRVFFGGSNHPDVFALPDEPLLAQVSEELRVIMGIQAQPLFSRVYRWPDASAQYDVGHLDDVAKLEAACPPGLYLTGSAYRGVGIPDCIQQGEDIAKRLSQDLRTTVTQ